MEEVRRNLLYWLFYEQVFRHFNVGPFRLFHYLTFRTAFASITAMFMGLSSARRSFAVCANSRSGSTSAKTARRAPEEGRHPDHGRRADRDLVLVPTILWADLSNRFIWLAMFSIIAFGAIGFTDDYLKVIHKRNLGLTARAKLMLQGLSSFVIAVALIRSSSRAATPPT